MKTQYLGLYIYLRNLQAIGYCKTMLNEVKQVKKKKGENDSYKVEKFLWVYFCVQCEGVHVRGSDYMCAFYQRWRKE